MPYTIQCIPVNKCSFALKKQLAQLVASVVPGSTEERILPFVTKAKTGDYCFVRDRKTGKILAYNYYHMEVKQTPFYPEPLPVYHFGSAYKSPELKGTGIIWKLGKHYAQHTLGRFWYLKRFVGATRTMNPRVAEYFYELFPEVYPQENKGTSNEIHEFNREHHHTTFGMVIHKDPVPYSIHPFTEPGRDFTELWQKKYHSRNPKMNELILNSGVVTQEHNRYFLTDKLLHLVGFYDPQVSIPKRVKTTLSIRSRLPRKVAAVI